MVSREYHKTSRRTERLDLLAGGWRGDDRVRVGRTGACCCCGQEGGGGAESSSKKKRTEKERKERSRGKDPALEKSRSQQRRNM